jgi:hypothetical protein
VSDADEKPRARLGPRIVLGAFVLAALGALGIS